MADMDEPSIKLTERSNIKEISVLFKLGLMFLSLLASIVILEIYLTKTNYPYQNCERVNISSEAYLGKFNEQTGWSYKKDYSYYDESGRYEYHFDKNGIRSASPNYTINYDKPRILFIGDSVTFGEELNFKDTYAYKINELLGNKYEVVNLGVQGFGSAQSMLRLKSLIKEIDPTFVVYTFIPDHVNRDKNYDRRLHVKCFEFSGTKPVFVFENGLKQIRKPQTYDVVDRFKTLLFLDLNWQIFREKMLTKDGKDIYFTKEIINEISNLSNEYAAKDYYIYFDNVYDISANNWNNYLSSYVFNPEDQNKILNFTNWAKDSKLPGVKYYVNSEDDYHPNASLSAEIAKRFVEKFKSEFIDLN